MRLRSPTRPSRAPSGAPRAGWAAAAGLLLLLAAAPAAAAPQRSGDSRVDYRIQARVEGDTPDPKTIDGALQLTWTNATADRVGDLWFHLYLNAFSNNRSTHLVESKGELRGVEIEEGWGWSRVTAVRAVLSDGIVADLFPTFRYERPDDGREDDRTVFSVRLPRPVEPGETIEVQVEWESRLPRVRRRTGYKDDFLLVAQWFPKLGVYEEGRGWNCHQFHMNTEFYSDYGAYEVELDLPLRFKNKVGGTGVKVNEIEHGRDRVLVEFVAPAPRDQARVDVTGRRPLVHDFAWTADPRYHDLSKTLYTFDFSLWAERFPGEVERVQAALGADVDLTLRDVDVLVLIHPERKDQADRHFEATAAALFFYGLWFGEYPYERVTVVDPAWGASAAGGMEYPTLFTCGTSLFTTPDMYRPESVTVHEAGHQFWYGLVGNNEFEAAWMDEGFNSYADSEVLMRVYGEQRGTTRYGRIPVDGVPVTAKAGGGPLADALAAQRLTIPLPFLPDLRLRPMRDSAFLDYWRDQPAFTFVQEWTDPRWSDRNGYLADPATDPIETRAWEYADRASYRTNSYPRPAVALRSLPALIGYDAFLRGMRQHSLSWRYGHPYPQDFYATFQEAADVDIEWYFRELFQGTGTVDWKVQVWQERRPKLLGMTQSEGGEFYERERPEVAGEDVEAPWQIEVTLRRDGTLSLPVPVRLVFEDESIRELTWTREEQQASSWRRIALESQEKLRSVHIDPERGYFLDADMSNNQWFDAGDEITGWRWGERALAAYQRYFHWLGGLGG